MKRVSSALMIVMLLAVTAYADTKIVNVQPNKVVTALSPDESRYDITAQVPVGSSPVVCSNSSENVSSNKVVIADNFVAAPTAAATFVQEVAGTLPGDSSQEYDLIYVFNTATGQTDASPVATHVMTATGGVEFTIPGPYPTGDGDTIKVFMDLNDSGTYDFQSTITLPQTAPYTYSRTTPISTGGETIVLGGAGDTNTTRVPVTLSNPRNGLWCTATSASVLTLTFSRHSGVSETFQTATLSGSLQVLREDPTRRSALLQAVGDAAVCGYTCPATTASGISIASGAAVEFLASIPICCVELSGTPEVNVKVER